MPRKIDDAYFAGVKARRRRRGEISISAEAAISSGTSGLILAY